MKRTFILGFLMLIAAGCTQQGGTESVSPPPQQVDTATPVPPMPVLTTAPPLHETSLARRITVEEARAAVDRGEAVLVDVRTAEAYALEHPRGAVSLPENDLTARVNELPREKLIITFCT